MAARMTRRDMLRLFTTGMVGAMVLDPEKLLWVPGEKTIFLPPLPAVPVELQSVAYLWQLAVRMTDALSPSGFTVETEWVPIGHTDKMVRYGSNEP